MGRGGAPREETGAPRNPDLVLLHVPTFHLRRLPPFPQINWPD